MITKHYQHLSARRLACILGPAVAVLVACAAAGMLTGVSMATLTRDPSSIADVHPLAGFLSTLGTLVWCATAAICAFAAATLPPPVDRTAARFLLSSGLVTSLLLGDDLFQFHEYLADRYFGLDEHTALGGIAGIAALHLLAFRRFLLASHTPLLLLALGFLSASVVFDTVLYDYLWRLDHWQYLLEDGLKWLGIVCWSGYHVGTARRLLARTPAS
jgi:hypothetical protein